MQQIDIYGVFLPTLLIAALAGYWVFLVLRRGLVRVGAYRFVWHRPLFDVALYGVILGLIGYGLKWFVY
ncbi:DUF1656 domain-containing protein [Acidimangrovimonas sediminis]|uniref:DUF1656 domain-containing protein n=1 Tax=Acidimangrovimonas sediminis TaxID=2056283 RepID=UPI001E63FE15|nr:DUF1656 domain-containing protein [Acidimangrovimonas sediminis]